MLFLAATAGIFEECGRYIIMKTLMKSSDLPDSLAFGAAHGGTEAVLLVGINSIAMLTTGMWQASGAQMFLAGIERLCAMNAHICWSVLVWRSIKEKKPLLLGVSVILHTVFDFAAVYMPYAGAEIFTVEAVVVLMSVALLLYTSAVIKKINNGDKLL